MSKDIHLSRVQLHSSTFEQITTGKTENDKFQLKISPIPKPANASLTSQFTFCLSVFAWSESFAYDLHLTEPSHGDTSKGQQFVIRHNIKNGRGNATHISMDIHVQVQNVGVSMNYNITRLNDWVFICFGYDFSSKNLTIKVANKFETFPLETNGEDLKYPENAILGLENMYGKLTNIKIFDNTTSVQNINCTTAGTYLKWDPTLWTKDEQIKVKKDFVETVCSVKVPTFLMLSDYPKSRTGAEEICKSFANGQLFKIYSQTDLTRFQQFVSITNLLGKFWVDYQLKTIANNSGVILGII